MRRALLATLVTLAAIGSRQALRAQESATSDAVLEFCRRARELAPRDADAHVELARWCASRGLADAATRYFRSALAIDSDHPAAREALGFVRFGTEWVTRAERLRLSPSRRAPGSDADEVTAPADASDVEISAPAATSPSDLESAATTVASSRLDEELQRKRAWAADIAAKLQMELFTIEDEDFLVHSTVDPKRDPKVRQLQKSLRDAKKLVAGYLGLTASKAPIWPSKVQFVLLRSEQQYEQFAELVDDVDYAKNPDGGYTHEGHTVLWNPDSWIIVRQLAESCFDGAFESDRQVSWWLPVGFAAKLEAMLKATRGADDREKQTSLRLYARAAEYLQAKDDPASIYWLLESRELSRRDRAKGEALAMTLVDFLSETSRSRFQKFVRAMKSSDAPYLSEDADEEEAKTYWLNYFAFQEKALESEFRKNTEQLDAIWKQHVARQAARFKGTSNEDERGNRGRNRN